MADKSDKDIVTEAKERFERAKDAYGVTRVQAIEDTKFAMGDSDNGWQWPDDIRAARALDKKVCLTVNMTAQHCNQIIVYGHTHRPLLTIVDVVVTVMNPGGAGHRRFGLPPSVGILELEPGIPPRGRLLPLLDFEPA